LLRLCLCPVYLGVPLAVLIFVGIALIIVGAEMYPTPTASRTIPAPWKCGGRRATPTSRAAAAEKSGELTYMALIGGWPLKIVVVDIREGEFVESLFPGAQLLH